MIQCWPFNCFWFRVQKGRVMICFWRNPSPNKRGTETDPLEKLTETKSRTIADLSYHQKDIGRFQLKWANIINFYSRKWCLQKKTYQKAPFRGIINLKGRRFDENEEWNRKLPFEKYDALSLGKTADGVYSTAHAVLAPRRDVFLIIARTLSRRRKKCVTRAPNSIWTTIYCVAASCRQQNAYKT